MPKDTDFCHFSDPSSEVCISKPWSSSTTCEIFRELHPLAQVWDKSTPKSWLWTDRNYGLILGPHIPATFEIPVWKHTVNRSLVERSPCSPAALQTNSAVAQTCTLAHSHLTQQNKQEAQLFLHSQSYEVQYNYKPLSGIAIVNMSIYLFSFKLKSAFDASQLFSCLLCFCG